MEKKRFPWGRTVLLGFGFLGISIIWPIFNQYIPLFLQAGNPDFERQLLAEGRELPKLVGFGLAPGLAMFIMTWDNLINMFIAPWAGSASDRTWNRLGRRNRSAGIRLNPGRPDRAGVPGFHPDHKFWYVTFPLAYRFVVG
jgi:maltose/moltooligosaccharide transporter